MLNRIPKYCHIARTFGGNGTEARRQLKIWRKDIGRGIGVDATVHLYHSKTRGWALVLCSPDYLGYKMVKGYKVPRKTKRRTASRSR